MEEVAKKWAQRTAPSSIVVNRLPPLVNWKIYTLRGTCKKVNIEMINLKFIG
jgi:hypothetical protein